MEKKINLSIIFISKFYYFLYKAAENEVGKYIDESKLY